MTAYRLSPKDHQALLQCHARVSGLITRNRQLLEQNGMLESDAFLVLERDQAYADRVKELIDLLARGCATKAEKKQLCGIVAVRVAEMDEAAKADIAQTAVLRGMIALHELGEEGELVTVN